MEKLDKKLHWIPYFKLILLIVYLCLRVAINNRERDSGKYLIKNKTMDYVWLVYKWTIKGILFLPQYHNSTGKTSL